MSPRTGFGRIRSDSPKLRARLWTSSGPREQLYSMRVSWSFRRRCPKLNTARHVATRPVHSRGWFAMTSRSRWVEASCKSAKHVSCGESRVMTSSWNLPPQDYEHYPWRPTRRPRTSENTTPPEEGGIQAAPPHRSEEERDPTQKDERKAVSAKGEGKRNVPEEGGDQAASPNRREEERSTTKKDERKTAPRKRRRKNSNTPKEGGDQAAPPKGGKVRHDHAKGEGKRNPTQRRRRPDSIIQ